MNTNQKSAANHTYCNPLPIPQIPRGKDGWYKFEYEMFSHENKPKWITGPDYRSISDPTVFYHEGKWYLYPSYGMAWVSEDFVTWKHHRTEPYCSKYSPSIARWKDQFLLVAWNAPLYVTDNPLGPFKCMGDFILPDGKVLVPSDPGIFADDDGRLYIYTTERWNRADGKGKEMLIVGYELDPEQPTRIVRGPVRILTLDAKSKPWERMGKYNQNTAFGWVEGPHMLKYRGRYYLIYAAPDTRNAGYCNAVYYSDKSPLDEFVCQKNNPLTYHREGLITGAGHGCVERGPNDTLWAFYTVATPVDHEYERRIGMDLIAVDENGELYCPFGVTDTPQYAPGYIQAPLSEENSPRLYNLTAATRPIASSVAEGRSAIYATDENNLSWWQPHASDPEPWIECDLDGRFLASAVRVFWRDVTIDYAQNILPVPVGFILEGELDGRWSVLLDYSNPDDERNIEYQVFDDAVCERVRLRITSWNQKSGIGVVDFAVFGVLYEDAT